MHGKYVAITNKELEVMFKWDRPILQIWKHFSEEEFVEPCGAQNQCNKFKYVQNMLIHNKFSRCCESDLHFVGCH